MQLIMLKKKNADAFIESDFVELLLYTVQKTFYHLQATLFQSTIILLTSHELFVLSHFRKTFLNVSHQVQDLEQD